MTVEHEAVQPCRSHAALYGVYWLHKSFCVLEESEARARAAEVAAVKSVTTLGELRRVALSLRYTRVPADLDELEGEPDDMPWDWQSEGLGVEEGDWPRMPTSCVLDCFSNEQAFIAKAVLQEIIEATDADVLTTVFNGDYLHIPLDKEHELVETLGRHGISAIRDDQLVEVLGMEWGAEPATAGRRPEHRCTAYRSEWLTRV